jgi:superfamily II DNA/RNA helicase
MNTQLKKGDKCNSPWGVVTVNKTLNGSDITTVGIDGADGIYRMAHRDELTRIPSHAERMQVILDIAWDVENRLDDNETVQLKVGEFVEFARHYYELQQELLECVSYYKSNAKSSLVVAEQIEKLLKGETS